MKNIILIQLTLVFISCSAINQETTENETSSSEISNMDEANIPKDSITIKHKFADEPFDQNNNLDYFSMKMRESTKIDIELKNNHHDPSVIDTIKTIFWDKSYIKTLTNKTMDRTILIEVNIKDNNLVLANGLKIGQPSVDVFNAFHFSYDKKKNYAFLELITPDDPDDIVGYSSSLIFYFKNDKLTEINYWPWYD